MSYCLHLSLCHLPDLLNARCFVPKGRVGVAESYFKRLQFEYSTKPLDIVLYQTEYSSVNALTVCSNFTRPEAAAFVPKKASTGGGSKAAGRVHQFQTHLAAARI